MDSQNFQWPDDFPKQCPPQNASKTQGTFFRLVREPISAADFQSEYHLNERLRHRLEEEGDLEVICRSRGLSIFSQHQGAVTTRRRIKRFRNSSIAQGELIEAHGMLRPTPSTRSHRSHCTWWVPTTLDPLTLFEPVEE